MIDEKKLIEKLKKNSIFKSITNAEGKNIYEIIEEQPKMENTVEFKHFLLSADSTLKSQNKEYLLEYIHMLYLNWRNTDYDYNRTIDYANELHKEIERLSSQVIEANRVAKKYKDHNIELMNYITQIEREYKDNPPLRFEEIKADMWIWDNRLKIYLRVISVNPYAFWNIDVYTDCTQDRADKVRFEENKFYRREVKE